MKRIGLYELWVLGGDGYTRAGVTRHLLVSTGQPSDLHYEKRNPLVCDELIKLAL